MLRRFRREGCDLVTALDEAAAALESEAVAILTGRFGATIATAIGGRLQHVPDQIVIDTYAARVFNARAELRWRSLSGARSDAVLVTVTDDCVPPATWPALTEVTGAPFSVRYLLWGQATEPPADRSGWTRLAEARIGTIDVPIVAKVGDRVQLVATEVHVGPDEDGNVAVADELLVGIEVGNIAPTTTIGA
jgi:CRISPR-associated protein (TIGR03984 family)